MITVSNGTSEQGMEVLKLVKGVGQLQPRSERERVEMALQIVKNLRPQLIENGTRRRTKETI